MKVVENFKFRNYYALRVTGGQEINVALMLEERIKTNNIKEVYSIVVPPNMKGYIIIEATGPHIVKLISSGIRHVKGLAHGLVQKDDVQRFVSKVTALPTIKEGDIVEIVSGPFRGLHGQVVRIEQAKNEVVLNILDSSYQVQFRLPIEQVKPIKR